MEIITLVENSCYDARLQEEFGLSLLVKTGNRDVLFDMGSSSLFSSNAGALKENLQAVDCAVISHAHYDHGGGLATFLGLKSRAPVYIGRQADGEYYGNAGVYLPHMLQPLLYPVLQKRSLFSRYVGLDRSVLKDYAERIVMVETQTQILDNIYLLADIPVNYPLAEGNTFLLKKKKGKLCCDTFDHELVMVAREPDGLVLITGCGHRGILNMVNMVKDSFNGEHIKAVVGGFHLARWPGRPGIAGTRDDICCIGEELAKAGVDQVITGHCTGDEACSILEETLGDKFSRLSTGSRHCV